MNSRDKQRRELVEWSPEANDLVFRGTKARLADFWAALCGLDGMKGFLDRHPEVPVQAARDVLRLAGERFCWWPDDLAEQERARNLPDPRFEVAESDPDIRGGRLCFIGTSRYFELLFISLDWDPALANEPPEDVFCNGLTLEGVERDFDLPPSKTSRAVMIAAQLFAEGLVPDENLPRRGRSPAGDETPSG